MKILQVSTSDAAGGAERSAHNLARAFRELGHRSWLAVGQKRFEDPDVFVIPNDAARNRLAVAIDAFRARNATAIGRVRGAGRLTELARRIAEPARFLASALGREDFDFPATARLLDLPPGRPDIVHLHNLHGAYFDLRALPALSRAVPTILNVRDGWLMSGHCAFGLDCERWRTGCGECPDLTLYPAVERDSTAFNWARKREILGRSHLFVTTPSEWMMRRVRDSIIAPAAADTRVIPNGVDVRTFHPGNRSAARMRLGIDDQTRVIMVAANGLRQNVWKDYRTLRAALESVGATRSPRPVIVLAVGENAPTEAIGALTLRSVPFVTDAAALADYYRAADVYVHAARVESFGNVLLEARACGTPVVATAVGGITEQVRDYSQHSEGASGILVPPGDAEAFARAISLLLENEDLRAELARGGLNHVLAEFTLDLQARRFISWYSEILGINASSTSR